MILREEYPRPQFRREAWQCMNGEWEFAFDDGNDGLRRGLQYGEIALPLKINVPFSYQYPASGIGDVAHHEVIWYRRRFKIAEENCGKRALLCFNAADYRTEVWINGKSVISHIGGYTPFSADITDCLKKGENIVVVRCEDPQDDAVPRGKQSWTGEPFACWYIPNSGIWQSVWLEFFGEDCIRSHTLLGDFEKAELYGDLITFYGRADETEITVILDGAELHREKISLKGKRNDYRIKLPRGFTDDYAWSPEHPRLLYVDFLLYKGGVLVDKAHTRIGLRKISVQNGKVCLNNRPYYQRLVLDQGYWKESGITPPSAEALKKDIELAKAMGFNGARKHQKAEDPYYCYYAEELGFLTWCEMPSAYRFCSEEMQAILRDWQEIVNSAQNCTSNVCYVPINENWGIPGVVSDERQQNFARTLYYITKSIDPTRLVSTNDGFDYINPSDILGVHNYNFRGVRDLPSADGGSYTRDWNLFAAGNSYAGQPLLFTEFGGIAMQRDAAGGAWGYNEGAETDEEYLQRLNDLMEGIAQTGFQGFCYTQLTDVQQEVNGLLTSERIPKVSIEKLNKIFSMKQ